MRRREFIAALGAAAWPLAADAQQPTMPAVGVLFAGSAESSANAVAAIRKGLSESGFGEGRNITVDYLFADSRFDRLPELVADLVRKRATIIVTPNGMLTALAAKAATSTIPIVFSTGGDPVQTGLVASLNRPGGNITGITDMSVEVGPKRFGILRELLPAAARFAFLVDPKNGNATTEIADAEAAAQAIGRTIEILRASTIGEIDAAFAAISERRAEALLVGSDVFLVTRRVQIVTRAIRHGVPAMFPFREDVLAGGLMSYGASVNERNRQAGLYVGRILKGDKPADLPVMRATKFEFVINLQTARTIGIEVPPTLLATADEVIE